MKTNVKIPVKNVKIPVKNVRDVKVVRNAIKHVMSATDSRYSTRVRENSKDGRYLSVNIVNS